MDALGLTLAGVSEVRVVVTSLAGLAGQPSVSLGVGGTFDNNVATTALSVAAQDSHEALPLTQPRPLLRAGDVLTAQLDVVAAGTTTYIIELVAYGFHRQPQ